MMETMHFDTSHMHDEIMAAQKTPSKIPIIVLGIVTILAFTFLIFREMKKERDKNTSEKS
jgi:hypothetical protein